ncbi:MAG: hypothetical protein AB1760_15160 [Pseudomonadota bacterium]
MAQAREDRTPIWFWIVAVVSLLWNAFGAYDYTMSHLQGEAYYRQVGMTEAQIAYMAAYPTWMHGAWALGVWGAVAGSLLLLLRSRFAAHAFAVSMLGIILSNGYALVVPGGWDVMGGAITIVIAAVGLLLLWLAWSMTRRGVLR